MANTFIELNDTPSSYTGNVQYLITAGNEIDFVTLSTNELVDINTFGAYAATNGQVLTYFGGANEFRPATNDPYSAGNGISKTGGTLNVATVSGGGIAANASGIYLDVVSGAEGVYGNATHVPVISVNSRGQIESVTPVAGTFEVAQTLAANHIQDIAGTSGQILVSNGTGVASNASVGLVATGVTAATYGNTTHTPQITVDSYGRIQNVDLVEVTTGNLNLGDGNVSVSDITTEAYRNITVGGQTTLSADRPHDTLNLVAGAGITLVTTASSDTLTISSTGGGGGGTDLNSLPSATVDQAADSIAFIDNDDSGASKKETINDFMLAVTDGSTITSTNGVASVDTSILYTDAKVDTHLNTSTATTGQILSWTGTDYNWVAGGSSSSNSERFKLNYASDGELASTSDLTSGITSVVIDSASGGEVTITFNNANYNYPPGSVVMYGYDYPNNNYILSPVESTMTLRTVAAGGTSGSPTLFDGSDTVVLRFRLREAETGASRNFGTTTHAWIQFIMNG